MSITLDGTSGIVNDATDLNYTGTLTGGTGVVNLGSGQVYKDASGNVGIGTSSPANLLTVNTTAQNADQVVGYFGSSAVGSGESRTWLTLQKGNQNGNYGGALGGYLAQGVGGGLVFGTHNGTATPVERARITSDGYLLVAMSSSVGVARTQIAYTPNANVGLSLYPTNTTYNNASVTFLNNGGTTVGFIYQNGSSTQFSTTSDYRLKENVQPMTGALAKVQALKPVTYTWKSTGETDEGFIAHELQALCPSAVNGEKDAVNEDGSIKPQGIDTSFLVATLTAAIQEQQALIESLTARVAALEQA